MFKGYMQFGAYLIADLNKLHKLSQNPPQVRAGAVCAHLYF